MGVYPNFVIEKGIQKDTTPREAQSPSKLLKIEKGKSITPVLINTKMTSFSLEKACSDEGGRHPNK